jgi:hypothetical protein
MSFVSIRGLRLIVKTTKQNILFHIVTSKHIAPFIEFYNIVMNIYVILIYFWIIVVS